MNKDLQKTSSKELDLSYTFTITDFHNRHFTIEIGEPLRELKYSDRYQDWFMEDLIFFLSKNNYQLRWDISRIKFTHFDNLGLSKEDAEDFKKFLTEKITNFKIVIS